MNIFRNIVIGICIILGILMTVDYIRIKKLINEFRKEIREVHDTIVKTRVDSIFYLSPIVYKVKEIRGDTVRITDVKHDSVDVILPVIQKEYRDSTYRAWVSGYKDVNLDSIEVYQKNIFTEINNTKYLTKYKNRQFSVGILTGYGYDFMNKCGSPYIGIGVQYNLFSFGKRK